MKNHKLNEITEYDNNDTTEFINKNKPLKLNDLGFSLPKEPPTKIISIRIPTKLYNTIKSFCTNMDMSYQAYIKYLLDRDIKREINKFRPARKKHVV